jgi:hypothetical protein
MNFKKWVRFSHCLQEMDSMIREGSLIMPTATPVMIIALRLNQGVTRWGFCEDGICLVRAKEGFQVKDISLCLLITHP